MLSIGNSLHASRPELSGKDNTEKKQALQTRRGGATRLPALVQSAARLCCWCLGVLPRPVPSRLLVSSGPGPSSGLRSVRCWCGPDLWSGMVKGKWDC